MKLLDGFLWGYSNWEAADVCFRKFRQFYPDGNIFIKIDLGGDIQNYEKIAEKYNAEIEVNPFRVGRCGIFGDYANTSDGPENSRECWPKESAIQWCDNIYDACVKSDAKFLIIFEEDSFILKPISVLDKEFGIMVFEYNTTIFPDVLLYVIEQFGGNIKIPLNMFGNKGYGAGGGFIIDRKKWIDSWERFRPFLEINYDEIKNFNNRIGWSDCIAQMVIMAGGYEVIQNPNYVQTWFEGSNLYPKCNNWREAEIVDYLKDLETIKTL
jgi:hypothetical protein